MIESVLVWDMVLRVWDMVLIWLAGFASGAMVLYHYGRRVGYRRAMADVERVVEDAKSRRESRMVG